MSRGLGIIGALSAAVAGYLWLERDKHGKGQVASDFINSGKDDFDSYLDGEAGDHTDKFADGCSEDKSCSLHGSFQGKNLENGHSDFLENSDCVSSSVSYGRVNQSLFGKNSRYQYPLGKELKRWGTKQGVIEVANDLNEKKQRQEKLLGFLENGKAVQAEYTKRTNHLKDFLTTQITLTNKGNSLRTVSLWGYGAPRLGSGNTSATNAVDSHIVSAVLPVGKNPQFVGYNPFNNLLYVLNQLGGSVTIINPSLGSVITTVQLGGVFPGLISPVQVDFNPANGEAWVVCSVENTIKVLDNNFAVIQSIPAGNRPMAIAFNPTNNCFYVSNLYDDTLLKIDASTYSVLTTLNTGTDPRGVAVWEPTGSVWVSNSTSGSVNVYDKDNTALGEITNTGIYPTLFAKSSESIFLIGRESLTLTELDPNGLTITSSFELGFSPTGIAFNPINEFLYIISGETGLTSIYNTDGALQVSLDLNNNPNIGIAVLPTGEVFSLNTAGDNLSLLGFEGENDIVINEDYKQKQQEFQFTPALVKHAKFVFSDSTRGSGLKIIHQTPTGHRRSKILSFNDYKSPQHFLEVAEMTGVCGEIIDGRSIWELKINPGQTITFLIYYKQLQFKYLLPKVSRSYHKKKKLICTSNAKRF